MTDNQLEKIKGDLAQLQVEHRQLTAESRRLRTDVDRMEATLHPVLASHKKAVARLDVSITRLEACIQVVADEIARDLEPERRDLFNKTLEGVQDAYPYPDEGEEPPGV